MTDWIPYTPGKNEGVKIKEDGGDWVDIREYIAKLHAEIAKLRSELAKVKGGNTCTKI